MRNLFSCFCPRRASRDLAANVGAMTIGKEDLRTIDGGPGPLITFGVALIVIVSACLKSGIIRA